MAFFEDDGVCLEEHQQTAGYELHLCELEVERTTSETDRQVHRDGDERGFPDEQYERFSERRVQPGEEGLLLDVLKWGAVPRVSGISPEAFRFLGQEERTMYAGG